MPQGPADCTAAGGAVLVVVTAGAVVATAGAVVVVAWGGECPRQPPAMTASAATTASLRTPKA